MITIYNNKKPIGWISEQFIKDLNKLAFELEDIWWNKNYPPTKEEIEESKRKQEEYKNRLVFAISENKEGKRITHYRRLLTGENYYFFKDDKYCDINNPELIEESLQFIRYARLMDI